MKTRYKVCAVCLSAFLALGGVLLGIMRPRSVFAFSAGASSFPADSSAVLASLPYYSTSYSALSTVDIGYPCLFFAELDASLYLYGFLSAGYGSSDNYSIGDTYFQFYTLRIVTTSLRNSVSSAKTLLNIPNFATVVNGSSGYVVFGVPSENSFSSNCVSFCVLPSTEYVQTLILVQSSLSYVGSSWSVSSSARSFDIETSSRSSARQVRYCVPLPPRMTMQSSFSL